MANRGHNAIQTTIPYKRTPTDNQGVSYVVYL